MTSYASEMPESPGVIPKEDMYKSPNPYNNIYEERNQQLSSIQEENLRLKANLTRVQNEYEELRDESNYQRAKVSELTELVKSTHSNPTSFPQSQNPREYGESAIHNSLIEKSLQNAELTLALDKLKIELQHAEARLAQLEMQKKANGKLLIEMGDVIRTLNSVSIEYATFTPNGEKMSAQQKSVNNIKLKVEAMLRDRDILVQKCRELNDLTRYQEKRIQALEAHIARSVNMSQGHSLDDIEPDISVAASSISDDTMSVQSSIASSHQRSKRATDAAASEIVRQSQELAKYKKKDQAQNEKIAGLQSSEQTYKDTISRLEAENDELSSKTSSLKESLRNTKGALKEAVTKRDEFKDNLKDIISHYKELQIDHDSSNDTIAKLESLVVKLQSQVEETQEELEKSQSQRSASIHDPKEMEDLRVAYDKAQKEIEELKQIKLERNDFQRKLDEALEETRLAKLEIQKEKEETDQVRRQLKILLQHQDDDIASLDTASLDTASLDSEADQSRSRSRRDALVKKASFKPLTIEELMAKDFS